MDTERELARVALHESGHAVAWGRREIRREGLPGSPVKCCIVRLGKTGRYCGEIQSDERAFSLSGGAMLKERVACWLAGREAELEEFGDYDEIGASHDLRQAGDAILLLVPPRLDESKDEWAYRKQTEMEEIARLARERLRLRWVAVQQVAAAILRCWHNRPAGATEARLEGQVICSIIDAAPVSDR